MYVFMHVYLYPHEYDMTQDQYLNAGNLVGIQNSELRNSLY